MRFNIRNFLYSKFFDLTTKLSEWFPKKELNNKKYLTVKQLFSHYSGMKSWIPFYKEKIDSVSNTRIDKYYSNKKSIKFPFQAFTQRKVFLCR